MPIMSRAIRSASPAELASFTPPPLPRPPAWICALTTTPPPSRRAMSAASAAVYATSPRGTGTPCRARIAFAWYSWIFTGAFRAERARLAVPTRACRQVPGGSARCGVGVFPSREVRPRRPGRCRVAPRRTLHVRDDGVGEPRRRQLGRARHLPGQVVGHLLLLDGALDGGLDRGGRFAPAQVLQHHHAREHERARIHDVFARVLRSRAVGGLEKRDLVPDVRPG